MNVKGPVGDIATAIPAPHAITSQAVPSTNGTCFREMVFLFDNIRSQGQRALARCTLPCLQHRPIGDGGKLQAKAFSLFTIPCASLLIKGLCSTRSACTTL